MLLVVDDFVICSHVCVCVCVSSLDMNFTSHTSLQLQQGPMLRKEH
jgi:hypothetical protein